MSKILIVLTSHTEIGDTGKRTGFYFDEMATPYWKLVDAGHDVDIASIKGGKPEYDPSSVKDDPALRPEPVQRFLDDAPAMAKLAKTAPVSSIDASKYDGIFLSGGHGTMYDFPVSDALAEIVGKIYDMGGVVAAVCHGPAGLVKAKRADGQPIVSGLRVNAFTDAEEEAVGLSAAMPFLLESELRSLGGRFEGTDNFKEYSVRDGRLVTGQNPASAQAVAETMLVAINEHKEVSAA